VATLTDRLDYGKERGKGGRQLLIHTVHDLLRPCASTSEGMTVLVGRSFVDVITATTGGEKEKSGDPKTRK